MALRSMWLHDYISKEIRSKMDADCEKDSKLLDAVSASTKLKEQELVTNSVQRDAEINRKALGKT